MTNQRPNAIFIMGPTASGKTALAAELFKRLACEIISVDSAMIYRGMNVGTATPTDEEQKLVPHHLVNILDPADVYSAARFRHDALEKMASAIRRKKTPVLVGGTMLYFKSLLNGLSPLPKADAKTRQAIAAAAQKKGWEALHCDLKAVDPTSAARIHPNDPQRLSRALEVFYVSGKTLTELTSQTGDKLTYNVHPFAVAPDERCILHQRITQRFHTMLERGLETEVRSLFERGDLHPDLPSIRCVGYRQMWDYLEGKLGFQEMKYRAIVATRQLAKRQMTWLKNWNNLTWLNTEASCNINLVLRSIGCR